MNELANQFRCGTFNMPPIGNINYNPSLYTPGDLVNRWFTNLAEYENPKEENVNWKFRSSAEADINWKDISDALSYAEPLALVTRKFRDYDEDCRYVVVNDQLWNKAMAVYDGVEDVPASIEPVSKRKYHIFRIENNFSEWVAWAKWVKEASWPDGIKSTFKVVLPTI
ncbi:MAG: hypothetical protein GY707_05410 [Desulfobacteraceae bacterium]|nr:hypothetical protein [Desulfobacteraceae bacterium]